MQRQSKHRKFICADNRINEANGESVLDVSELRVMYNEERVLCGASSYEKRFYLNDKFKNLPEQVKQELQIMCVMFTEEVGGTLILEYDEDGYLQLITDANEDDILYDEIGSGLKIHQIQLDKRELLEALEMYYRVFVLGEGE